MSRLRKYQKIVGILTFTGKTALQGMSLKARLTPRLEDLLMGMSLIGAGGGNLLALFLKLTLVSYGQSQFPPMLLKMQAMEKAEKHSIEREQV